MFMKSLLKILSDVKIKSFMRNLHEKMYLDEFIFAMKHDLTYKILSKNLFIKVKQETQRKKEKRRKIDAFKLLFYLLSFQETGF